MNKEPKICSTMQEFFQEVVDRKGHKLVDWKIVERLLAGFIDTTTNEIFVYRLSSLKKHYKVRAFDNPDPAIMLYTKDLRTALSGKLPELTAETQGWDKKEIELPSGNKAIVLSRK